MPKFSLANPTAPVSSVRDTSAMRWLTTAGAARMLTLTTEGVRWLVRAQRLTCVRTPSGQRLFRESDVLRLVEQRAKTRAGLVAVAHRAASRVAIEPHQLSLFPPRLRLVAAGGGGETSLEHRQAKGSRLFKESA